MNIRAHSSFSSATQEPVWRPRDCSYYVIIWAWHRATFIIVRYSLASSSIAKLSRSDQFRFIELAPMWRGVRFKFSFDSLLFAVVASFDRGGHPRHRHPRIRSFVLYRQETREWKMWKNHLASSSSFRKSWTWNAGDTARGVRGEGEEISTFSIRNYEGHEGLASLSASIRSSSSQHRRKNQLIATSQQEESGSN